LTLLDTEGDFGARLNNEAAASRYIKTRKSKIFDSLFNKEDINVLPRYNLEGKDIEYQFLTFNLPMVLINSQEGMGSGHAQKILGRDPKEVKDILVKKLNSKNVTFNLKPYFKGFEGTVEQGETPKQWVIKGVVENISAHKTRIVEVPISESYKSMIKKLDKLVESKVINSYEDLCDPKKDKFLFVLKHDSKFGSLSQEEKLEKLKLTKTISENYTCIDAGNKIKVFNNTDEIFNYYYDVRLSFIQKRKDYTLNKLSQDIAVARSRQFYILKCINDEIILKNKSKKDIIEQIAKFNEIILVQDSYNYLINMPMHSVSKDTVEELIQKVKELETKYEELLNTSCEQLWLNDIKDLKL
jgi:DNA topoisomerase-2